MESSTVNFDRSWHYLDLHHSQGVPRGGINEADHECLTEILESQKKEGLTICEIGSWTGTSAVLFGLYAKENNGRLYCIDTFEGNENLVKPAEENNIRGILQGHLNKFDVASHTEIRENTSALESLNFPKNTFDIIFLDGDHGYMPVKNDIELYWPKLKVGGVLCGHDLFHGTVNKAVKEKFPNKLNSHHLRGGTMSSVWYYIKTGEEKWAEHL